MTTAPNQHTINHPMKKNILFLSAVVIAFTACKPKTEKPTDVEETPTAIAAPEWSKSANIYEVNLRQYTPEGTIKAFEQHLPRLKDMGVDVLWLMPIHPIGEKNRKGGMGSYYSVKDYKAVGADYGTMEDFKAFVKKAHDMDMKVIIDWVANHTAWDNPWITEHPEWYTKDSTGNIVTPWDWTDVAQLNYNNMEMRQAMIDALKFWVKEADIDGYRCDVAFLVPTEFWIDARKQLDEIKPVFMLAEAEDIGEKGVENALFYDSAFDANYAWEFHHIMNEIAKGNKKAADLDTFWQKEQTRLPERTFRMAFTSNHDENSWNGTEFERMGEGYKAFAILAATYPKNMFLLYSGQEVGLKKRMAFFEKDTISWGDTTLYGFYRNVMHIKKNNEALWNGNNGGTFEKLAWTGDNTNVYAFKRVKGTNEVTVILNLSGKAAKGKIAGLDFKQAGREAFSNALVMGAETIDLKPWEYLVMVK